MALRVGKTETRRSPVTKEADSKRRVESTASRFEAELTHEAEDQQRMRLEQILSRLEEQGRRLGQTPTYVELKAYRELVKKFMAEAVGGMYELETNTGWDRKGRQKVYTLVKKIDAALEELTEYVRHGQEKQLNILEKLGSIRGMLVDLYT